MRIYFVIAVLFFSFQGNLVSEEKEAKAEKNAFVVEVKKFGRPILWLKPKPDSNEDLPVQILADFFKKVSKGDLSGSQKMCFIGAGSSKGERPTVTDVEFKRFISEFQNPELTRIVLSYYAIRGKSGYVSVDSKITKGGKVTRQKWHFSLKRIKGVWKVSAR